MSDAQICVTCLSCDCPDTHEHVVTTHRRHLGLVLLAWKKPRHGVHGQECGALQRPLMVNSEHGDGRGVLYLPA